MKFGKRIFAFIITAGITVAGLGVCSVSASTQLKNIVFTPNTTLETEYLFADHSSQINGSGYRFMDGISTVVYKIPLADKDDVTTGEANLVVKLSGNFDAYISSDNSNWTNRTSPYANVSTREIMFDVMSYINEGDSYVYLKVGDQTTNDGYGGCIEQIALVYYDYTVADLTPMTTKMSFKCASTTDLEKRYIYSDTGSQVKDSSNFRFMDGTNKLTYQIPYDSAIDSKIYLALVSNYMVWISAEPDSNYKVIAQAPEDCDTVIKFYYDCSEFKGQDIDYLYVRIGDQTTNDGNGGCIYEFGLLQAPYTEYDPFDITGIEITPPSSLKIYQLADTATTSQTDAAGTTAKTTVSTTAETTTSSKAGSTTVTSGSSTTTSSEQSGESSSVGTNSTAEQINLPILIIISIIALLLIGGAVFQFVVFEKKRQ